MIKHLIKMPWLILRVSINSRIISTKSDFITKDISVTPCSIVIERAFSIAQTFASFDFFKPHKIEKTDEVTIWISEYTTYPK